MTKRLDQQAHLPTRPGIREQSEQIRGQPHQYEQMTPISETEDIEIEIKWPKRQKPSTKPISDTKRMIPIGTYAGRELLSIVEGMVELNQFVVDDQVIKKNKLKGIMTMILNLNELDNSVNLKDGRPGNELLTYHVTDDEDFMSFEPQTPQYKALKNDMITSLALKIMNLAGKVIADGPQVNVVLHIKYNPLQNGIRKTIKPRTLPKNT